jgi:hypothetical protein
MNRYPQIAHNIYTGQTSLRDGTQYSVEEYIEYEQRRTIKEDRGLIFYSSLVSAMSHGHWGREVDRPIFFRVLEYCQAKLAKKAKEQRKVQFTEFLTDAGIRNLEIIKQKYTGVRPRFLTLGLLAMRELDYLLKPPGEFNQTDLHAALVSDLGFKSQRQTLDFNKYIIKKNWQDAQDKIEYHKKILQNIFA